MKRKRNRYTTFTFYDLKWKRILFTFRTERTIGFRYRRRYIERDRYGRTLRDFKLTMDDGWAVKRESTILRESTFGLRGESERFNPDVSDILSTEDRYRVAPRRGKRAAFWTGGRKVARLRFEYRRKYHFFFRRDFVDDFDIESVRWNVGIIVQVAHALHCPTTTDSDLAICLRGQDVDTLLNVKIHKPSYVPAFAPLIDNAVIPDKPYNLMKNPQMFDRYIAGWKAVLKASCITYDWCVSTHF